MTNVMEAVTIPLKRMWACTDCDVATNMSGWCPQCGNTALLNLAEVLNRKPNEPICAKRKRRHDSTCEVVIGPEFAECTCGKTDLDILLAGEKGPRDE